MLRCDARREMRCAVRRALCSGLRLLGLAIAVAAIVSTRLAHGAPVGYSVPLSCTSLSFGPVSATATRTRASASSAAPSTASAFTLRRSGV